MGQIWGASGGGGWVIMLPFCDDDDATNKVDDEANTGSWCRLTDRKCCKSNVERAVAASGNGVLPNRVWRCVRFASSHGPAARAV